MSEYVLIPEILALSKSRVWAEAKTEWVLDRIIELPDAEGTCLCSHFPIKELCHIRNIETGNMAIVGNCCIKKFLEIEGASKIFNAIKNHKINKSIIDYALDKNIINSKQSDYMKTRWRKRDISFDEEMVMGLLAEKIFKNVIE
jgi:hypothetical protein